MTDQLDDLFADLRAGAVATVRPPGVDAARRTVRRRRRTRLVAAGAAVLALAGGVAWAVRPADRPIPAAASPLALFTSARDAVDRSAAGPALATRAWETDDMGRDLQAGVRLPAGAYLLVVACAANAAGESLATVGPQGHADPYVAKWVPCGSAPTALRIGFRVPKTGVVTIRIGENITSGPTGYAFQVVRDR